MSTKKINTNRFYNNALKVLEGKQLNTPENIDAIAEHQKPLALSYALCTLDKYKLLTSENRNRLTDKNQPQNITDALNAIDPELATQENLNKLFNLETIVSEVIKELLYRIPKEKLTQTVFDDFMHHAQLKDPIRKIHSCINLLLETTATNNDAQTRLAR